MGNKDDGRNPSAVRKSLEPLIAWYQANKPECKRVACTAVDMARLEAAQKRTLERNNITKDGDKFYFNGFELYRKP